MIVIRMESKHRERNQRKLKLGTWNESNRLYFLRRKKVILVYSRELLLIQEIGRTVGNSGDMDHMNPVLNGVIPV